MTTSTSAVQAHSAAIRAPQETTTYPIAAVNTAATHRRLASSGSGSVTFSDVVAAGTPPSPAQRHQSLGAASRSASSDDSESEVVADGGTAPYIAELKGYLSKWTNYIHGWQPRYIVLCNGTLSYYKSEVDSDFGCRGAISLHRATIKSHEFDDCRIDVSVNNCVWYLRADTPEDKMNWIDVLQSYNTANILNNNNVHGDPSSASSLRRHDSSVSLLSTTSGSSLKRANRSLREKVYEIETFKDILFTQIDTLQRYFDACAEMNANTIIASNEMLKSSSTSDLRPIDLKGESITFRATTTGVLTTLQHCLDIINERDDIWKQRMDKEIDRRRRSEGLARKFKDELDKSQNTSFPGPDLEEGPHSTLPEDEFFDAVESGLDKIEEDRKLRVRLRLQSQQSQLDAAAASGDDECSQSVKQAEPTTPADHAVTPADAFGSGVLARSHRLWPQIEEVCTKQLHHARLGVGEGDSGWQLFADEGEMKMFRREEEVDGMVVDPLKAVHVVQGVSAKEMCHYFFMPEYRNDWESTLEDMTILEQISPDAIVFLQTHKRIWPATQRDALFWSHMRNVRELMISDDPGLHDAWAVCNHSIEHNSYPAANSGKCIRLFLTVILLCQTYVRQVPAGQAITRDDLTCKITYCSVVNPGGWAPKTALRAVYKREYPKFLKRFTQYVVDQCKDKSIMF